MESRPQPPIPQKYSSFSSSTTREDKKLRDTDRNLSLDSSIFHERYDPLKTPACIDEGDEAAADEDEDNEDTPEPSFTTLSEDIDCFITALGASRAELTPEITDSIERFVALVEREVIRYEAGDEKWTPESEQQIPLLGAVDRLSKLASALELSPEPTHFDAMSRTGGVLHHAMCFLEDEFFSLLDEPRAKQVQEQQGASSKTKRGQSFGRNHDPAAQPDRCIIPQSPAAAEAAAGAEAAPSPYQLEVVARLQSIAAAMVSAGYGTECCQMLSIARHNAFEAGLSEAGFEKVSIDDVQRMAWDSLEAEIAKWIKAYRHSVTDAFPQERELCDEVLPGPAAAGIFRDLARSSIIQFLNFAEAVAMTKRSAEKLFKVLDMYEALRDMMPKIEHLFPPAAGDDIGGNDGCGGDNGEEPAPPATSCPGDLKSEITSARTRLGDAAVAIFCDLEGSIKSDAGKTPVPGGAVHPLTRYVMNYLKYACEYKNTLEQVFKEHQKLDKGPSASSYDYADGSGNGGDIGRGGGGSSSSSSNNNRTPFANQLVEVMELLHANIEGKSRLYKDLALSNIFMMNNGRYIVQKIKGSAEINQLLGDTWCRKRSSDLRQYHKNYQRETWSKVLACFKDEGLTVKGNVQKPVLKERFKNFNAMFDEIHKTQSSWIVSDEQLQSELRVSVSAVVVPAYRSFLGRFSQYLDPGRQTEKYIKFGAEDLETYIDELFDGNPMSMVRRRT